MFAVHDIRQFFRANPQALLLLLITVVLGLGTFIAVLISIAGSGNGTPDGEPTDAIAILQALSALHGLI